MTTVPTIHVGKAKVGDRHVKLYDDRGKVSRVKGQYH